MRNRVPLLVGSFALAVIGVAACERARTPVRRDSARVATPEAPAVAESVPHRAPAFVWDSGAGPAMLVRTDTIPLAAVLFPEQADTLLPDTVRFSATGVRGATVDLFARSGRVGQARIAKLDGLEWIADAPTEWPAGTLEPLTPGASLPHWTVGLVAGRADAIPLDSIEHAARADSAQLAAEVTRIASSLPNDTAAAFRGIPYAVRAAYRFQPAPGISAVAAELVRHVPQEASPAVEHIFVVAERDSASTGSSAGRYRAVYADRSSGTEEVAESTDVLAALSIGGTRRPALVLEREGFESAAYTILERTSSGEWKVRWTSVHVGG
jgi:hypothetical protein